MSVGVADCLRLAYKGGPEYPYRGMTLCAATGGLELAFEMLSDLEALIEAQTDIVARNLRLYGETSRGYQLEQNLLANLEDLQARHNDGSLNDEALMIAVFILLVRAC